MSTTQLVNAGEYTTHQYPFRVVRAHPLLVPRWHEDQGWIETVEVPVKLAIVARDDSPPSVVVTATAGRCSSRSLCSGRIGG